MNRDELHEQFKAFSPDIQAAVKRAFAKFGDDLKDEGSRASKSIQAIGAFAQDPKKARPLMAAALKEDPALRAAVYEAILLSRKKKRALQRKEGIEVDDPRRRALVVHRGPRHRR